MGQGSEILVRGAGTLVIYLFGDTDPNYRRNFEFFIEHGMESAGGEVEYVIIVQQVT